MNPTLQAIINSRMKNKFAFKYDEHSKTYGKKPTDSYSEYREKYHEEIVWSEWTEYSEHGYGDWKTYCAH